jgi:aspartate-semialdehyde dehydrogenase
MSATRGIRLGLTGATGALGTEVLAALDAVRVPIAQLVAVAGERSLGAELDFQDALIAVAPELPALQGLDLLINCAPAAATPDVVRAALRAEVPCIDCSGVFAQRSEVPLAWAGAGERIPTAPLLAAPADAALVWLPILRALAPLGAPAHVRGVILEGASALGRAGIDALSRDSLALFNSQDPDEDEDVQGPPLAFDCRPSSGALANGRRARESALAAVLARALSPAPTISARWIQVPAFVGHVSALSLSFERAVDAGEAALLLAKASGVELWNAEDEGPNLRAVAGRDVVVASRPDPDAASPNALFVWAAGDLLRLAAANAAALTAAWLAARTAH